MHFVSQIAVKSKDRVFFKLDASRSTSEPFGAPFGPLLGPFGEVFLRLLGFFDHSWAAHGRPTISFWPPTSRQKGLWSAKLERLEPHNLVLERFQDQLSYKLAKNRALGPKFAVFAFDVAK